MEWSDQYSTGVDEMDEQHKILFELIAILRKVCHGKVASEDERMIMLDKVIERLVNYTVHHFSAEEELMLKSGYPDLIQHKKRHDMFTETVHKYKQLLKQKKRQPVELLNLVESWIKNHILTADQEYAPSVKSYQERESTKSADT